MVKKIVHDTFILAKKSMPATQADGQIAMDLLDTLLAHKDTCVGMAANMIGELKRIIAVDAGSAYLLMYNPQILSKQEPYDAEEGCLSLFGKRKTTRFNLIKVSYQDANFIKKTAEFSGFVAQIIQHEIDHCNGILI